MDGLWKCTSRVSQTPILDGHYETTRTYLIFFSIVMASILETRIVQQFRFTVSHTCVRMPLLVFDGGHWTGDSKMETKKEMFAPIGNVLMVPRGDS